MKLPQGNLKMFIELHQGCIKVPYRCCFGAVAQVCIMPTHIADQQAWWSPKYKHIMNLLNAHRCISKIERWGKEIKSVTSGTCSSCRTPLRIYLHWKSGVELESQQQKRNIKVWWAGSEILLFWVSSEPLFPLRVCTHLVNQIRGCYPFRHCVWPGWPHWSPFRFGSVMLSQGNGKERGNASAKNSGKNHCTWRDVFWVRLWNACEPLCATLAPLKGEFPGGLCLCFMSVWGCHLDIQPLAPMCLAAQSFLAVCFMSRNTDLLREDSVYLWASLKAQEVVAGSCPEH